MKPYLHADYVRSLLLKSTVSEFVESKVPKALAGGVVREAISLIISTQTSSTLDQILKLNEDTFLDMSPNEYIKVTKSLDFETILKFPFYGDKLEQEYMYLLWHPKKYILLKICTSNEQKVIKEASMYFNFLPNEKGRYVESMGDGKFKGSVWAGSIDVREGLKFKIYDLELNGKFYVPWVLSPYFDLLTYMEKSNKNKKDLTKERISVINNVSFLNCIKEK